jgi:outer membrane protein
MRRQFRVALFRVALFRVALFRVGFFASVLYASPLVAQQVRTVTLSEALQLAVGAQPTMVQARQDVRVADANERQSLAAFLPSLTSTANTSKSGGSRVSQFGVPQTVSSYYSSSLGFALNWDIFTGFRRGAARRNATATSGQREATLSRTQYATVLATQQAFYQALANAELVGVQETRVRAADEQLKLTTERLRLGATTRSDSLRARVEYGNAQLALITAQNNLRNSQAALARQIQVDGLVMPARDSVLFTRLAPLDTAALMREALASAPAVREADAAVAAARAQRNVQRSAYMPTVTFTSGYTFAAGLPPIRDSLGVIVSPGSQAPFGGRYAGGWSVGLRGSYTIFNNYTREVNLISAEANEQSALSRQRDARLGVTTSLVQYIASFDAAAARIDVSTVSVAAAEEDLRMQRERYRLGAATILEVLTSQATLDQAQVDLVQARYDYLVARAQIEAVVGHSL